MRYALLTQTTPCLTCNLSSNPVILTMSSPSPHVHRLLSSSPEPATEPTAAQPAARLAPSTGSTARAA